MIALKTLDSPRYLLIDSGNTRTKAAIYQNNNALQSWIFDNDHLAEAKEILVIVAVDSVLIASSGSYGEEIRQWFSHVSAQVFNSSQYEEIHWAYSDPERLGHDRMAGMIGAITHFPNENICLVSAGTCLTFDFLQSDKMHLGGFIAPGLEMRLKAMNSFTSKLPYVSINQSNNYPGMDTETCLSGGAVWGAVLEIEGHFDRIQALNSGPWRLVLTGGDAEFLAQRIKADNFVVPDLVIQGLNAVLSDPV